MFTGLPKGYNWERGSHISERGLPEMINMNSLCAMMAWDAEHGGFRLLL